MPERSCRVSTDVLHVIVGHGLPVLYLNTLRSFRAVLPRAPLLVIDNASPQAKLRRTLADIAEADPDMQLILRSRNEPENGKVGGLYAAYRLAFGEAGSRGARFVHLMQADMQLLWWDDDTLTLAEQLLRAHPSCVNILTVALSKDRWVAGDLSVDDATGHTVLNRYGLTDTGLYDLERWARSGAQFADIEEQHARRALEAGMQVVVFPWATEIQVPWPAVIRKGRQRGREVRVPKEFLCKPLSPSGLSSLKKASGPVTLEDVCVPWGWSCLAPMWNTDLDNVYYWALRRKDVAVNGLRRGSPRWVTTGLDSRADILFAPHRPSLVALLLRPLAALMKQWYRRHGSRL